MSLLALLMTSANAQEAAAAPAAQNGMMQFLPLVFIFVIFYFLILRPQKKKLEQEAKLIGELKKGDEIYTKAGILGKIHGLTEKVVTLEVEDGVKLKVLKSQIAGLAKTIFEEKKND
ncbi:preprotein translocase subunit YajC [Halobacteriovorax sp. GB3]|uniref:preprotein translocase subunit YajC n=1 Tax=Halobacteriovorax sp. GB3 TaxID=2719615 RepID=UPI00235E73D0|nr:preprotein translocase subunit YajC [Halobacteriovorax sp. GB3]MDD0852756.1 preprotein translocase subunit YajC [Halobacteriovorax sp. GB3]